MYVDVCIYMYVDVCIYMSTLQARRKRLEGSVKQFGLFRECDDVESWITEKVRSLVVTKSKYCYKKETLELVTGRT